MLVEPEAPEPEAEEAEALGVPGFRV